MVLFPALTKAIHQPRVSKMAMKSTAKDDLVKEVAAESVPVMKVEAKKNVAVIFGVTGLVGKEIAMNLLKTGQWKVYGVARKPEGFNVQNSNYHFISCDLLNPAQTMDKLSSLKDVTNIFWVTWAQGRMQDFLSRGARYLRGARRLPFLISYISKFSSSILCLIGVLQKFWGVSTIIAWVSQYVLQYVLFDQESCDKNTAMMSNALDAVLPKAKSLRHVSLQTGSKHYLSLNDFADNSVGHFTEDLPRVAGVRNFYYALEDLLKERLSGNSVGWSVHRPSLLFGSSQRTLLNIMGCLTVYASICKHLKKSFLFGGTRQCWEEFRMDASDARLVAEQHIWAASINTDISSKQGEAFNAINGTPFIWKEIWPALANKFGVEIPADNMGFSSSFSVLEFMADKGHVWEEIVSNEGLTPTKVEDLANWAYMDLLFQNPVKMLASRDKANRLGFNRTYEAVDSILYWIDCMRDARLIP